MGYLHQLAALVSPQDGDLRDSIRRVSEFAQQVRDSGLSHVLEVIFDQSVGEWDSASAMHDLVDAITGSFGGRVVFGNLNYDTLLLAALLYSCKDELADLGHGWKAVSINVHRAASKAWRVPATCLIELTDMRVSTAPSDVAPRQDGWQASTKTFRLMKF